MPKRIGISPKKLARAELLKLPALSYSILDPLEKALQNREEPRILPSRMTQSPPSTRMSAAFCAYSQSSCI